MDGSIIILEPGSLLALANWLSSQICSDKSISVHVQAQHLHGKSLTINKEKKSTLKVHRPAITEEQLTMDPKWLTVRRSAELCTRRFTQCVDHADSTHVELEEGVVDGLPSLVVHEEVIEHGAQLGRQASQEVHHAQPRDADLRPGNVERQQHQEANQRDAWGEEG